MVLYRIAELMLPTIIQRHDKNHSIFDPVQDQETNWNFTGLSDATFYDRINTLYQFIKLFLDIKCLFLRSMESLNKGIYINHISC